MTSLEVLALAMLAVDKSVRDAADPHDFGSLSHLVAQIKNDPKDGMRLLLLEACGITWDSNNERFAECVLRELLAQVKEQQARKAVEKMILTLDVHRKSLYYKGISTESQRTMATESILNLSRVIESSDPPATGDRCHD